MNMLCSLKSWMEAVMEEVDKQSWQFVSQTIDETIAYKYLRIENRKQIRKWKQFCSVLWQDAYVVHFWKHAHPSLNVMQISECTMALVEKN